MPEPANSPAPFPVRGNTDLVDRGAGTPLERMVRFFEALRPEDVDRLAEIYAHDAQFVDPFNDVKGTEAIGRIFAHMFVQLDEPRFIVLERLQAGEQAFLTWDFVFRFRSGAFRRSAAHPWRHPPAIQP
jgi:ketosteroid isomerase-like protein